MSREVPRAIDITGNIKFESLDINDWMEVILNRNFQRSKYTLEQTEQLFVLKGLSIGSDALGMQDVFKTMVEGKDIYK